MAGAGGQPAGSSGADPGDRRLLAYLILGGLALLFCTIVVVVAGSLGGEDESASASSERRAEARDLPAYWKVRRGDTYVRIAERPASRSRSSRPSTRRWTPAASSPASA